MKISKALIGVIGVIALTAISPISSFAADTSTVVPKPAISAKPKVDRALINAAYATAVSNAANGFAKAVADLKALYEQDLISAAGKKNEIAKAKNNYKINYTAIFQAYTSALNSAKQARQAALTPSN